MPMGKALEGVRILDMSHVQAGPTCTQLLAWFGADVIKVERPGVGDITRGQLQDVPKADSLYFTMLNHNKRSITLDTKHPKGKEVLERLIKTCDVLVENFGPGVLDRMGYTWERIQELNPRMIYASIKGFGPGPLRGLQGLRERGPVHGRRRLHHRLPRWSAAGDGRADRRLRHRPAPRPRHRHGPLSPHQDRQGPARDGRHAGRRLEPDPREDARPAAPEARAADGIQPARRGHCRSARPCRAPATTPAAASRAAS